MATTLNRMMKRAASSAIPLANRTIPRRKYTSALFSTPLKTTSTTFNNTSNTTTNVFVNVFPTHHRFSALSDKTSSTDDDFLRLIDSEFDLNVEKFHEVLEAPREFPFKLTKNPDESFIRLTREYQGEEILVAVDKPDYSDCYPNCYIRLDVRVSQENGQTLVFDVEAETADDITINYFSVKNSNDSQIRYYLEELDENMQEYYYKYLEVRGIEPSIFKFLHNCFLLRKKRRKYALWLKNLNNFIAEKTSNTDESLIESEIDEKLHKVAETPNVLPFKIEDNATEETITLTREYQGEEIKVKVFPRYLSGEIHFVSLVGSVSKKSGLDLKFSATPGSNGIEVNSFYVENLNEPVFPLWFWDLDENLHKAYGTYLEARGIEPSIFKILCNYMVQRKAEAQQIH